MQTRADENAGNNNDKNKEIENLTDLLSSVFPIDYSKSFQLFPFCNESGYWNIIKNLKSIRVSPTEKIRAALLVGESNILSMLPILTEFADLIILSDIEPRLHLHVKHLLNCLNVSTTPDEFINLYAVNNPIEGFKYEESNDVKHATIEDLKNVLYGETSCPKNSLRRQYFLNSQEIFDQCKQALRKSKIVQINLDFRDVYACSRLANLLNRNQACFTLCNLTNLYTPVDKYKLAASVSALLIDNTQCFIMHAIGMIDDLRVTATVGLDKYISCLLSVRMPSYYHQASLFYRNERVKKDNQAICYVGYEQCLVQNMKSILDGRKNVNDYSTNLHAYDSYSEAEEFILDINKNNKQFSPEKENSYWIFTVRGSKEKVNKLLRYRDKNSYEDGKVHWHHYPSDYYGDGLEFYSRIIKVENNLRTIVLEKTLPKYDCKTDITEVLNVSYKK